MKKKNNKRTLLRYIQQENKTKPYITIQNKTKTYKAKHVNSQYKTMKEKQNKRMKL